MERIDEVEEFDNVLIDPDLILPTHQPTPNTSSPTATLIGMEVSRPALSMVTLAEPSPLPTWLSPLEVAAVLRFDRHTVYRLLRDGELPGTKIGGRWFVSVEALAAKIRGSR